MRKQEVEFRHASAFSRDARLHELWECRPLGYSSALRAPNVIDEVRITRAEFENLKLRSNQPLELAVAQCRPECFFAICIHSKAGVMIMRRVTVAARHI